MSFMHNFSLVSRVGLNVLSPLNARKWFSEAVYGVQETKFSSSVLSIEDGYGRSVNFTPIIDLQLRTMVGQVFGTSPYTDRRYCLKIQESTLNNEYTGEYGYEFRQNLVSKEAPIVLAYDLTVEEASKLMTFWEREKNITSLIQDISLVGGQVKQNEMDALVSRVQHSGLMPLDESGFADYHKVILTQDPDLPAAVLQERLPSSSKDQGGRPSLS